MSDLTVFPADLADMSVSQLANLPPVQLAEADANLDHLIDWAKKTRAKLDAALDQRFGEQGRIALRDSGRDTGTSHVLDGDYDVTIDVGKTVKWDQKQLATIFERIAANGDKPSEYIDVKYAVSEAKFKAWPETLRQPFEAARTVTPGKPKFTLRRVGEGT